MAQYDTHNLGNKLVSCVKIGKNNWVNIRTLENELLNSFEQHLVWFNRECIVAFDPDSIVDYVWKYCQSWKLHYEEADNFIIEEYNRKRLSGLNLVPKEPPTFYQFDVEVFNSTEPNKFLY
jgi:hypothetical protein